MEGNAHDYAPYAPASAKDAEAGVAEVVFYQLTKKFVDTEKSIPDDAQDVLYYTLAVGHHTGVIDCFEEQFRTPLTSYEEMVAAMPESDLRYKLEGMMRHGEIQIDKTNLAVVVPGLQAFEEAASTLSPEARACYESLRSTIDTLAREGAAYIMGRIRRP